MDGYTRKKQKGTLCHVLLKAFGEVFLTSQDYWRPRATAEVSEADLILLLTSSHCAVPLPGCQFLRSKTSLIIRTRRPVTASNETTRSDSGYFNNSRLAHA
jgi:hypothetical protein